MRDFRSVALPILIALLVGSTAASVPEWPDGKLIAGHPLRPVLPPDAIPSLDDPSHVPAARASFFAGDEPVIGVVVNGSARAYSLSQLNGHEVVNDELGGRAIAVTW